MSTYKLASIRIFSFDLSAAIAFYEKTIGFDLAVSNDKDGWAVFSLGGASLVLERCSPDDPEANELVGRFVGASIEVPDISELHASLVSSGVVFTSPPTKQGWGGVLAHFKDLDGNTVTLVQSVA